MNALASLCLASLLFISQSPQESSELKEAADLTESIVKLFNEQEFDEALPIAKRALEIRERLLPAGDQRIATSLSYLADIYIAKRNYGEARKVMLRLLQNQEQRLGPEDIGVARTVDRLALLYFREGDSRKAEDAYKRAIVLKEKVFKTDNAEIARSLANLAEITVMVRTSIAVRRFTDAHS
jgi:tetratricopeptide (TPR) repeat protein